MKKYSGRDYGILPGAGPELTQRIRQALLECAARGDVFCMEPGEYVIGTLELPDNTSLELSGGAVLLGSGDIGDYPENTAAFVDAVGHKRGRCLLLAKDAENIRIFGAGTVSGRGALFREGHPHYLERPFLVRIVNCRNVRIEQVHLQDAAGWCLHLLDSEDVCVRGVSIRSRCNDNNDGIDVDSCSRVLIECCTVDSGDDALCLKSTTGRPCRDIVIRDCAVTTGCSAFKIGTESVGDFENIRVEHCLFYDVDCCAVKIVPTDGANVRNVSVSGIRMRRCTGPVFVSVGTRLRAYFEARRSCPGVIEGLRFEDIEADCTDAAGHMLDGRMWGNGKSCVALSGEREQKIRDVRFERCRFVMQGGVRRMPDSDVPKMGPQYPEFHLLGDLPAWGFFAQDVEELCFGDGVVFEKKEEDVRPEMCCDRVTWRGGAQT